MAEAEPVIVVQPVAVLGRPVLAMPVAAGPVAGAVLGGGMGVAVHHPGIMVTTGLVGKGKAEE